MATRPGPRHGGAIFELAFLAPWIFFLFVGAVDCGFYSYALISVESAARVAVLYASTNTSTATDSSRACTYVRNELKDLPNVASLTDCSSSVLTVTAQSATGPDGTSAALVSVVYQSLPLIPIPGLLQNRFTWTRTVKMRLRG